MTRCRFESEWHEVYNGCLWNGSLIHRNVMKSTDKVDLDKGGLIFEHCSKILLVGDRIAVICRQVVQAVNVTTRSPTPSVQLGSMWSGKAPLGGKDDAKTERALR